jgi:recombination protein RecA
MKKDYIAELNKAMGKDIAYLADNTLDKEIEPLPTGILALDNLLGIGGLPKGRFTEISGLFSTGKSSLCLNIIGNAQAQGLTCAYIDAEYAFSAEHAETMGVDLSKLILLKPDCGEEVIDAMEILVREKIDLIVVDSVSAMTPRSEIEAEAGKPTMGSQSRLITSGLRKLTAPVGKNKTTVVFINQLRQNIMGNSYNPYITTGGMALRFYCSVKLELSRSKGITKGGELVGYYVTVKTRKNKIAEPGKTCELVFRNGVGFEKYGDLIDIAIEKGVITKEGNTHYFQGEKLAIGKEKTNEAINSNVELRAKILSLLVPQSQSSESEQ